jgi:2',3'-cyclic-nucleotide 2'-phosphodiesterase (5'-nucleotidase family)
MGRLGYAAVGVAERDLALGYDELEKRARGLPYPLVSTNFVKRGTTDAVFKPFVVVEAKRGAGRPPVRVGVMSVVRYNPVFLKTGPAGSNVAIAAPADMVRRYLDEVKRSSDVVVVLAAMSRYDAQRLASEVPGIDFVFGSYGGAFNTHEEVVGTTRIVFTGNQGKRVGETRAFLDASGRVASQETFMYFLTGRYPDDPAMLEWVQAALARKGPAAAPTAAASSRGAAGR